MDRENLRFLMGQSIVLGEIKAEVPLQNENSMNHHFLWQQYIERIESLSPESKVSRFCKEAGFMRIVEVGQYFITKDTGDLRQFRSVACREYTLPRDDPASQAKGWIQGNMRIGPVLEVRSKAKAEPQRRELAGSSPRTVPIGKRTWTDVEPGEYSFSDYEVSKKLFHLLRHSPQMQREENGAVHFWRIKENLQNQFPHSPHWSDSKVKVCLAGGGGNKRRYQYCTDSSGTIVYLRAPQGHSGRSLIDPSLQDNVIIQRGLFHHIYHIGCAFNLHSIINNGLIPGGQDSSRRQTVFFLPIVPRDKDHEDPEHIDFSVPRRVRYVHSAWKKHQDAVFWVDIDLAIQKGLTFYQTRSNAIILQGTLPAFCIPKVVRLKTGEVLYEKSYMSPRPPPKISLRHDHDWTRGKIPLVSTVDHQPEGKVVRQSRGEVQHATFSQLTQPIPKPICDRSGQPEDMQDVFVVRGETSRSHEINEKGFHEKLCASDRSGQPEITPSVIETRNLSENTRVEQTHDGSGQPDERNSSTAHTVKEQYRVFRWLGPFPTHD